ncbi:SURF1 family protein [Streptomyces sp. A0958]|uniref:SURF1 family protein n=1 Tax=Streptomyces sp. A0958 TaxID=2563101 RepID=UPI00109E634F|nr:SURF1 family protein [Streptomyces sp. A0958]THA62912.1 SURF1 family protein [Streptomyces sp. A0958]
MYRFLLTPRWWGINLFVVLAIPFCVFMGTWQLGRFEDRVHTHEAAEKQPAPGTRAAKPLDALLPVDTETSGRPATATGRYADRFLVPGRKLDDRQGFYVLDMLRTDSGKALPVVRGWLPGRAGQTPVPAAPTGRVTVTGDLQASESAGTAGVDATGGLPDGQVSIISAASLVNLVSYDVYDAWVTLQTSDTGGSGSSSGTSDSSSETSDSSSETSGSSSETSDSSSGTSDSSGTSGASADAAGSAAQDGATALRPVPATVPEGSGLDLKAFQNLGYTGEWFVFAAFVVFMWFRLLRREAEAARDLALGLVPDTEAPSHA